MAKDFSRHVYHSAEWQRVRDNAWARDHGLCQECMARGRITPAEIVHHIVELPPSNVDDPDIATNVDNLVCVCRECHSRVHGFTKPCTREGFVFDPAGNLIPVVR